MADVGVPSAVMGATPSATILGSGLGPAPASNGATQAIPAGTFHGLSIEAAVKKLLLMRRKTLGAQEIAASLREGGLPLQSETPANTVTSILHRAFTRGGEVVRIGRGQWGLQEWYPNQRFNRKGTED